MSRYVVRPSGGRPDARPYAYEIIDTHSGAVHDRIPENPTGATSRGRALDRASAMNNELSTSKRTRYPCPKGCGQYFQTSENAGVHASLRCPGIYQAKG